MNDRIKDCDMVADLAEGGSGSFWIWGVIGLCIMLCHKIPKNRKFCDDQCIKTLNYRANLYSVDYYSNTVAIFIS